MTTTDNNPVLANIDQATTDQLAQFLKLKLKRGPAILTAKMENSFLIVHYRTKAGYFIRATFNRAGHSIKKQPFRNWNEVDQEPFNPVNFE